MIAPSREQFYQELDENTFCGYTWCRKLYGYSMYDPKFLKCVYNHLDELGRDKVKYVFGVYFKTQIAYETKQMKDAAEWQSKQRKKYERKVTDYRRTENKPVGDWHGFKGFPPIH